MEKIILLKRVRNKIEKLSSLLFEKGYFAVEENALAYSDAIYDFINTIPQQQRSANSGNENGTWFCGYKPNKHTTWYITFNTDDKTWLIRDIFNNHGPDYADFVRSIKNSS